MKYTNKNSFAIICKSAFLAIFIAVFCNCKDEEEKWRKAIVEDETPWNHVYDVNPKAQNKEKLFFTEGGGYKWLVNTL